MKNRIPDYLLTPQPQGAPAKLAFPDLRNLAQEQVAHRLRQIGAYVQEHPVTGIGTAFCVGVFLGWVIKRK